MTVVKKIRSGVRSLLKLTHENILIDFQFRFLPESDERHRYTLARESTSYKAYYKINETGKMELPLFDFRDRHFKYWDRENLRTEYYSSLRKRGFIIADFDKLPRGFKNFQRFREYLTRVYKYSIILKTPSEKAKVLFLVEYDTYCSKSYEVAMRNLLGNHNLNFDISAVSFYKAFMSSEMIASFDSQKNKIRFFGKISEIVKSNRIETSNSTGSRKSKTVIAKRDFNIPLEIQRLVRKSRSYKEFLRVMLTLSNLDSKAFISQEWLAKKLGTSRQAIGRYIRRLTDAGFLQIVSTHSYTKQRATSYRAKGLLLRTYLQGCKKPVKALNLAAEHTTINDGEWNTGLFKLTRHFFSSETYMSFISNIPGLNVKKERKAQAKSAWLSHLKRLTKPRRDSIFHMR